jgi:opacity protein-like surface antigen
VKKIIFTFLAAHCVISAADLSKAVTEKSSDALPASGIYVGLGLENCQDTVDWRIEKRYLSEPEYITDAFSASNRHFSGQVALGYRNFNYFFWAIELNLSLNKRDFYNKFDYEDEKWPTPASLNIKVGNDVALLLKIGKTICFAITPYLLVGIHNRKVGFQLDYLPGLIAANRDDADIDLLYMRSGSSYSRNMTSFVFGGGIDFAIDKNTHMQLEYCCKTQGTMKFDPHYDLPADEPSYPRHFSLKNKQQHCLSLCFSRTISLQ